MNRVQGILVMCAMAGLMTCLPGTAAAQGPTEHGRKQADGVEVTLLSAPPLSPTEMQETMAGMGSRSGMQGMGGTMPGVPGTGGMRGGGTQPTHWIGVVVRDLKEDRVVPGLQVTLVAQKGGLIRTVALMPMPGSYGAHIGLPEKGRYMVTVTLAPSGRPLNVAFEFDYE